MAAKIILARGDKANKAGGLGYGELFWQKTGTGELGTLYIGKPDGTSGADLAIGGARSMESLFYKGTLTTGSVSAFPVGAVLGDFWIMGVDGDTALAGYKANDWLVCTGTGQFTRVNNSGGSAAETTYSDTASQLGETTVQDAINALALTRLQYAGNFDAAGTAYPGTPKPGDFYLSTSIGTVNTVPYKQGDAAFFDGTAWSKIPLSLTFPADGIQGTGTANTLSKFDSVHGITDSSITDNGSKVVIGRNTEVTGDITANNLIVNVAGHTSSGDPAYSKATISVPESVGNIAISLPATGGTLALEGANKPASEITYTNTGTSLVATTVQAALTEMAQGKMSYAGTITSGPSYPASPVIGGLYLLTADATLGTGVDGATNPTAYVKGDYAFYDPAYQGATDGWTQIPAGYSHAIDIVFDNAGLKLGDGTTVVTQTNAQTALAYLYGNKADLVDGKVPTAQLPDSVLGGLQYQGTFDASVATVLPSDTVTGHYYIVSGLAAGVHVTIGGLSVATGDWLVYNGAWELVDNSEKLSGIKVGAATLTGTPEIAGAAPITVTEASGVITVGASAASKTATGVVQIGGGLSVDVAGLIAVDATYGLTLDGGKLKLYLNTNGLEIDGNQKLGIKAGSAFTFGTGLDAGKLILADTVAAGTYTKVDVNAQGQVTGGATLQVSDVPISASGATGATEIYDGTSGVIAGLKVLGPVGIAKTADLITLDFTQTNATTLDAKFAVDAPTDFDWSSRSTTTAAITSIVGAVNANRADLDEYVALLRTQGAAVGTAAGANLIGTKGISGVTPTGGLVGGNATLQAILEGLAAYTNSQIANAAPNVSGTAYKHVMYNSAGTGLTDSAIKQNALGTVVTVNAKLSVGETAAATELDVYGPTKFFNVAGTLSTTFLAPTGVAGGGAISTVQSMPDQDGQLLNSNSTVDGGVY